MSNQGGAAAIDVPPEGTNSNQTHIADNEYAFWPSASDRVLNTRFVVSLITKSPCWSSCPPSSTIPLDGGAVGGPTEGRKLDPIAERDDDEEEQQDPTVAADEFEPCRMPTETASKWVTLPAKSCLHVAAEIDEDEDAALVCHEVISDVEKMASELSGADGEQPDEHHQLQTTSSLVDAFVNAVASRCPDTFEYDGHPVFVDASALHIAAFWGNAAAVKTLCQAGADVNMPSVMFVTRKTRHHGTAGSCCSCSACQQPFEGKLTLTALHWAAASGHDGTVQVLLDHGASIDACRREDGVTPLYSAARFNRWKTVAILLDRGAQVDIPRSNRNTPLFAAIERGYDRIARLLIDAGADINRAGNCGFRPLHLAACYGLVSAIRVLIDGPSSSSSSPAIQIDARSLETGETALHLAAAEGHTPVVRLLLEAGANPEAPRSIDGTTALHDAATFGDLALTRLLLEAGNAAHPMTVADDGTTPLLLAVRLGHLEVVRLFLERLAVTNWNAPLILSVLVRAAVLYGRTDVARLLLDEARRAAAVASGGAEPENGEMSLAEQETAMHAAARQNRVELVKMLIEYSPEEVNRMSCPGQYTPLHAAILGGHLDVARLLLDAGANPAASCGPDGSTPLHAAVLVGGADALRLLFDHLGGDRGGPDLRNPISSETPLHVAARCGRAEEAGLLLDRGADFNAEAVDSSTPLSLAIRHRRFDVLQAYYDRVPAAKKAFEEEVAATPVQPAAN